PVRPKPLFLSLWAFGAGLSLLTALVLGFVFIPLAAQAGPAGRGGAAVLRTVMVVMVLASAGALSVATGLAWLISRRLARPLERLGQAARAIARQPLGYVVQLPPAPYREAADLARTLETLSAELAREQAQKDAFLAAVAHELRTPLTYLQGYARSLLDGMVADPEAVRDHLTVIDREARRLGRMVGDLLDREALASGRVSLRTGPVDLAVLAGEAVEDAAPAAREKGVDLELEVHPPLPAVQADAGRLRQVLWNLLDNALAHTPPGGRIWVEVCRAGQAVEVTVHDTGTGFDPAESENIWRPFYRVDRHSGGPRPPGRRGYGLGLATVRQVIEAHGGTVHADGRPGQGASVGFRLPVMPPAGVPATTAPAARPGRAIPGAAGDGGDGVLPADEPGRRAAPGRRPPTAVQQPAPRPLPPAGDSTWASGESLVAVLLVVVGVLALATASLLPRLVSLAGARGSADLLIIALTGAVSTVLLAGIIALLYRAWMGGRST
ncbi:MAG TPA: ATP-binding protein, partial [Thermaerobacter sp.]